MIKGLINCLGPVLYRNRLQKSIAIDSLNPHLSLISVYITRGETS